MRKIFIGLSILSLAGCASFDPARNGAIKTIGGGMYTITAMGVFAGNNAEYAARHCASFNKKLKIEGNTTQEGIASGNKYDVLIFSCY